MSINIKYLGHSSFLFNIDNKKILTDPYFGNTPLDKLKRLVPCSITAEEMPAVDNILISHEHMDACDVASTNYLTKKFNSKVVAHQSVLNKIEASSENKIPINEFDSKIVNNINITAYPAHHPGAFYPLSFMIKNKQGKSLYFAGDTFMTKEHEELKPDVAILPIGGKRTMDLGTAIRVSKKMRPEVLIPMHYNTFEDIKRNPNELRYKLEDTKYKIKAVVIEPGKSFNYKY
jgi:L-ascorbate metabolism protein UlaG (beta-lactamase superfamily)